MTTREQLEAEAAELYPTPDSPYTPHEAFQERAAHVRAKTVSAEQVEAAAKVMWGRSPFIEALETTWEEWSRRNPAAAETWRENVRLTLTTAGLLVEGEER